LWSRNTDAAQVLRLEAEVAAAHAHSIALDDELGDAGHQQAAEDFVVPTG